MLGSTLRILIVGGGIAGLATARALRLAGFRPEVTEWQSTPMAIAGGIYLPGNAARALRELGLDSPVRPLGQVIARQRFLDVRGRRLCEVDLGLLWGGVGECRALPRAELHQVLLTAAGGEVRYGTAINTLELIRDAVTVTFDDGRQCEYDLVIGADGRHSTVRTLAALGGPARPVGQVVYRSVVTGGPRVTDWTVLLGHHCAFVVVPMGAGRLHCYADETCADLPDDPIARLRERFAEYGGPVPAVLDAIRSVRVGLSDEVELGRWSRGRVVLVGDAAHATAPTLAQGPRWHWRTPWCWLGHSWRRTPSVRRWTATRVVGARVRNGCWTGPATGTGPGTCRHRCAIRCCADVAPGSSPSTTGYYSTPRNRAPRRQPNGAGRWTAPTARPATRRRSRRCWGLFSPPRYGQQRINSACGSDLWAQWD